ncbi:MAG: RNA-guided endonuclease InsQ/TnpB family protein [Candidatus Hodarchaeota archaeon]
MTAKVKLADFSDILDRTMRVYAKAVQFCVDTAWKSGIQNRVRLHHLCYYELRERFNLHAQLACNAIKQAVEMIKGSRSKPEVSEGLSIRYNLLRCGSVRDNWTVLSLSTMNGRVKFQISVPEVFDKYLDWRLGEGTLVKDHKGRFFFCFTFSREVDIQVGHNDCKILAIDLGVNTLAVTSDCTFFGSVKKKRTRWERFVAELQAKGTPAARRKLKRFGGKWKRFMTWVNHNVSKKIASTLSEGDVLVMEDLTFIRHTAKYNGWVHKWAFRELQMLLEYKATFKGARVVYVNPHYTSKECSRCHNRNTSRRIGFFECKVCGHTLNSDLNGARNIAQRYMRIIGLGFRKQAPDLACDEVETTPNGIGLMLSTAISSIR